MFDHPMMTFFIFLLVLFLYLHITAQWKKGEDLEVYEMDYLSNTHLQEIASVKQPVLFEFPRVPEVYHVFQLSKMTKYHTYDLHVKDSRDYESGSPDDSATVDSVVLPFHSAIRFMESDSHSRYFSENNGEFLEETGLESVLTKLEPYLKPTGNIYSKLDVWLGSKNTTTPLRYHTYANLFLVVTGGKIRVKMTPWKSRKFLYPIKDYDQYEFRSAVNVWKEGPEAHSEMDKLRFLDFEVPAGYILSIPPYWWYSIRYSTDPANCVCAITFDTAINALAHVYDWGLYYLQQSNITAKIHKPSNDREEAPPPVAVDHASSSPPAEEKAPGIDASPLPPPPKTAEKKEIITHSGVYQVA